MSNVLTGEASIDRVVGGLFPGRVALVHGAAASGKTAFALRFLAYGVALGEAGVLATTEGLDSLIHLSRAAGLDWLGAQERGLLTVLDCADAAGMDSQQAMSELFGRLGTAVQTLGARRMVVDSGLPWLTPLEVAEAPQHVFSMIRALERLKTTSILTLPQPSSPFACELLELAQRNVPTVFRLCPPDVHTESSVAEVSKLLGGLPRQRRLPLSMGPSTPPATPEPEPPPPVEVAHPVPRHAADIAFSGSVHSLSIPDVLQMIDATRKSGVLLVTDPVGNQVAELGFRQGQIMRATSQTSTGEQAVRDMLRSTAERFSFREGDPGDSQQVFGDSTIGILLAGMQDLDERRAAAL